MKLTFFFSLLLLTLTARADWQDEAATGALLLADDQGDITAATQSRNGATTHPITN